MKNILMKVIAAVGLLAVALPSYAITLSDANIVGIYNGGYAPGQTEDQIAQNILDGMNNGPGAGTYQQGGASGMGSGTLDTMNSLYGEDASVPAGYEYAIAKYDDINGGAILFYLGGLAFNLPTASNTIWGATGTEQYGLSHFTAYNASGVPDGGTTALLLGAALIAVGLIARQRKIA